MKCPKCGSASPTAVTRCESCGFHLADLTDILGLEMVRLDRLTDAAHCMRLAEFQHLNACLEDFERRFPQVFVAVYFGVLPPALSLGELSFWLLNQAAFNTQDVAKLNEYAIILVIDPVAKAAGLNVGYALEKALPEKALLKILRAMRTPLWHGEYVAAIEGSVRRLEKSLKRRAHHHRMSREIAAPDSTEAFLHRSGLRPLRKMDRSLTEDWKRESETVNTPEPPASL